MDAPYDLLIKNISTMLTCTAEGEGSLGIIKGAAIASVDGKIAWVGKESELPTEAANSAADVIDARGAVAFPGLIDSHTHLVFGGSRQDEWARKLAGVPYMQIAAEGGGINATVRATRAASEDELYERASRWLDEMLSWGVTCVEGKTGYGLDTGTELKILEVMERLDKQHAVEVIPTFMGAHDFPPEYRENREAYIRLILDEMLPAVGEQGYARFCDVFCEEGAFSPDQASRILIAAQDYGMVPRLHADQFRDSGAAELAADIGAIAADHLENMDDRNIPLLKEKDVVAGLLPICSLYLNYSYPQARKMLDAGMRVAIATDFNPGSSMCSNLPFAAQLACMQMKMRFDEAILGITRSASESLLMENKIGMLAEGLRMDIALMDIPTPEYFLYHVGRKHTWKVIKRGKVVWENSAEPVFLS